MEPERLQRQSRAGCSLPSHQPTLTKRRLKSDPVSYLAPDAQTGSDSHSKPSIIASLCEILRLAFQCTLFVFNCYTSIFPEFGVLVEGYCVQDFVLLYICTDYVCFPQNWLRSDIFNAFLHCLPVASFFMHRLFSSVKDCLFCN